MRHHIIVSGDDALAMTIIEELKRAGATVVRLANTDLADTPVARELARAEVAHAVAVVCAGDDDATNLEIALLARKANPNVRVVARLANDVLREAVADDNGPGAIFNVAEHVWHRPRTRSRRPASSSSSQAAKHRVMPRFARSTATWHR
jgi:Trk K+ transport system NAD-binding subunit